MKLGFILALALAGSARSQPGKPSKGGSEAAEDKARTVAGGASLGVKACHDDIEKFCREVKPGKSRLGKCLKANAKKLAAPCRRWLAHGGQAHVDRAFLEIDESSGAAKAPAAAKP